MTKVISILKARRRQNKQDRIHSNPVKDGLAGAIMQKWAEAVTQKCDLPTDTARCRVACPQLKTIQVEHVTNLNPFGKSMIHKLKI